MAKEVENETMTAGEVGRWRREGSKECGGRSDGWASQEGETAGWSGESRAEASRGCREAGRESGAEPQHYGQDGLGEDERG